MGEVMVRLKKNYYKMEKTATKLKIRVANYRVDPSYIYDAFKTPDGDDDYMYIGAYPGSVRWFDKLGSSSSDTPMVDELENYRTIIPTGYRAASIDKFNYLFCAASLILKSFDFNKRIGTTITNPINGSMNTKGLFYGTLDGTEGNKFLGIENLWSDLGTMVEGIIKKDDVLYYKERGGYQDLSTYTILNTSSIVFNSGFVSDIFGDSRFMYPTQYNGSSNKLFTNISRFRSDQDGVEYPLTIGSSIMGYSHMMNMDTTKRTGNMRLAI